MTISQFRGCIAGGTIGDVFGAQFEGRKFSSMSINENKLDILDRMWYTDDTEMTFSLSMYLLDNVYPSNVVIDKDKVHVYYARYLTECGYSIKTFGTLRTIKYAASNNASFSFLPPGESIANGAVMRIAPLGLIMNSDNPNFAKNIENALWYTHKTEEACVSAKVLILLINNIIKGNINKNSTPLDVFATASQWAIGCDIVYVKLSLACQYMNSITFGINPPNITKILTGNSDTFQIKSSDALVCAMWSAVINWHSPIDAIRFAIELGGDTDTIAKITGNIMGALHGDEWITNNNGFMTLPGINDSLKMGSALYNKFVEFEK